ncbi:ABC transporter permease [Rhizobium sp. L1K21]|uniref:MlaE family ABC transporter permease n=1 Tax=Rhizobium sp. L1K21 TaxID=2954933 RepID=UPI0020921712|nr:ABC transporter permease [Rhizobium sp. L1K21]MCO6186217.1 ABC transporter permease [Rhizobium sp. L1K21]
MAISEAPASLSADNGSADTICTLRFEGDWRQSAISDSAKALDFGNVKFTAERVEFQLEAVEHLDTSGAWLVRRLMNEARAKGYETILKASDRHTQLIEGLPDELAKPQIEKKHRTLFQRIFEPVGISVEELWRDTLSGMNILGSAVQGAQLKLGRGSGVSPASIVTHLDRMGVRAVPIIVLMSFLIGAIIAQQGAFQLRYFGAEIFVVDLVSILQLREVGVLLTAIMVAGRSGSAITAELGSMKMREEIDALTVMGLNPVGVVIFPRLVALTIALPLLTIVANFAALLGAAVVAWAYSGITFEVFQVRLQGAIDYTTIASGLIKAPFMALIVGIISALEGMKVGGSAESLGHHVTTAVVKSIFIVILVDGLFAMFYAAIDF